MISMPTPIQPSCGPNAPCPPQTPLGRSGPPNSINVQKKLKELRALGLPENVAQALVKSAAPTGDKKIGNVHYAEDIIISVYQNMGCWKDTEYWWDESKRAIPSLEGLNPKLSGDYTKRKDPIGKCADTAKELGYKVFALQNGGQCLTSKTADKTFGKYGRSNKCRNGVGGPLVSDVYSL